MFSKKGQGASGWMWAAVFAVVLFGIFALAYVFVDSSVFTSISNAASAAASTAVVSYASIMGKFFAPLDYILGGISQVLVNSTSQSSAVIISLAMWAIIFITFGDIFATFSSFRPPVAWTIAFLLAVIAANLKLVVVVTALFIGLFAFLASLAVLGGLVAAFVVFFGINWGIKSLGPMIMQRRAMMEASRTAITTEAEAKKVGGTIRGLKTIGKELARKD